MMTRKQALKHASLMEVLHGEDWLVFQTPINAPINSAPLNFCNRGPYAACRASERADYEAGGCTAFETSKGERT